jgi:hypothetical protein
MSPRIDHLFLCLVLLCCSGSVLVAASGPLGSTEMATAASHHAHLVITDANGKRVGSVVGVLNVTDLFVALSFSHINFVIGVGRDGFDSSSYQLLGYPSADCTGQAYVYAGNGVGLLPGVAVAPPGQTLYVETAVPTALTVNSTFRNGVCTPGTFSSQWSAATAVVDLSTEFTPPFSVALR